MRRSVPQALSALFSAAFSDRHFRLSRSLARPLAGVLALAALAAVALHAEPAHAQASGSIIGNVFDQNGMPLKGVKVTAKSATDIGTKTVYTDDEGYFRIIGLMPGTFTLSASSAGLRTIKRDGLRVGLGDGAAETLIMEVETSVEEVVVVQKAPVVNTTSAKMVDKFDEEFLDALPLESKTNIQGVLANQVAGAVGDQGNPQVRGGTSTQNSYQLEGFEINSVGGGAGQAVTFKSVAALEMSTGGYGAENANAAGAVMNAVTKSGSNKFEFEIDGFHENSKAQFFKQNYDSKAFNMESQLSINLLGPIIKDRLWFFTTVEGRNVISTTPRDETGLRATPPRFSNNTVRSNGKLTFQLTSRNKLQGIWMMNRDSSKNGQRGYDFDRDAQTKNDTFNYLGGLIWESVLSDNLLFRSQAAFQSTLSDNGPETCRTDPENCDHVSALRQRDPFREYQNYSYHGVSASQTLEFKNTLEYFLNSKSLGDHSIKMTARFKGSQLENRQSTPGDSIYVFNEDLTPYSKRTLYVNDPNVEDGRFGWAITTSTSRTLQFSLQDQFKLPKYRYLTLTPGVGVMNAVAEDARGNGVIGFTTATPHVAAAWDVTHDGRTVLRGSYNHYLDGGNLDVANFVGENRTRKVCLYDAVTRTFSRDCVFEGGTRGRTVGLPCGTDGFDADGNKCSAKLGIPRTTEYTFGGEREVVEGVAIGSDFQYRQYERQYEDLETNQLWNSTGTNLDVTGGFKNGQRTAVLDLETPDSAKRRYMGVVTSVKKREGKFKANFSYQWARLEGNVVNGFQNPYLNNPSQDLYQYGFLPGDSRHSIRSQATYQINAWLSTGMTYNYTSGTPVNLMFFNEVTQGYSDFRAKRGFHPGAKFNDPTDDYEWRLPDRQDFNLQIRANLKPITRFDAEFYVDFLNLLALRTVTGVRTNQDSLNLAGSPTGRMAPFRARLGFRFKY